MVKRGIKFKMKDGTFDYYDPLEEADFQITQDVYVLDLNYLYEMPKEEVEYFEWYDICEECVFELKEEKCERCAMEYELKQLKNGY